MKNLGHLILLLVLGTTTYAQQDLIQQHYGKHSQQTLDLYLPKTFNKKTSVIVMLHGGAWMLGGKEYTEKTSKDLRDRGFVVVNVDYRYVNDSVHAPELLDDIENAIGQLQKLAKQYNFSSKGYHIAGISAGAHLALLYGYKNKSGIKSISALCPPTRFDDRNTKEHLEKTQLTKNVELLADSKFSDHAVVQDKKFTDVSPYSHIKNIPTLLVHGDSDKLVPYSNSSFLYGLLQMKKIDSKLLTMKGKDHDAGMNDPDSEKLVLDEITNWVNSHN